VTLPNVQSSAEMDPRGSTDIPGSTSAGSSSALSQHKPVTSSPEKVKRKQKPPAIRIVSAESTESILKQRAAQPTAADYPLPPSPVPVLAIAKAMDESAALSKEKTRLSQRLRKSSLPNLFSRRERDAAAAAIMQALPPSPTVIDHSHDVRSSAATSPKKMATMPTDDSVTPQTPTSPTSRPFSPLSLFFGQPGGGKMSSQLPTTQSASARSGSTTPTMSKKELKKRQKEERAMIKELEKVDKMVRKHDKQTEKEKRKARGKGHQDNKAADSAVVSDNPAPRSPLRRLTFFGQGQPDGAESSLTSRPGVAPTECQHPLSAIMGDFAEIAPKSPRSKGLELQDEESCAVSGGRDADIQSVQRPIDILPPVLPTHNAASATSVDMFDSLYEQVNAMELSFGHHYPIEAQHIRKIQGATVPSISSAPKDRKSSPFMARSSAVDDAIVINAADDLARSSPAAVVKDGSRAKSQRESSSTTSIRERDSSSSNDSIASSLSSTVTPITPSLPSEAKVFGAGSVRTTSLSSDEMLEHTMISKPINGLIDAEAVVVPKRSDTDDRHTILSSTSVGKIGEGTTQLTKHGKAIRIGANPKGFRFPPAQPDSGSYSS
jgi:hypothetical protein